MHSCRLAIRRLDLCFQTRLFLVEEFHSHHNWEDRLSSHTTMALRGFIRQEAAIAFPSFKSYSTRAFFFLNTMFSSFENQQYPAWAYTASMRRVALGSECVRAGRAQSALSTLAAIGKSWRTQPHALQDCVNSTNSAHEHFLQAPQL